MPIELVINDTFDNVQDAVKAAFTECGFAVRPSPMAPGVEVKAKMGFWLGEKGNKLLAQFLPFLFKVDSIAAIISAYQDGTTAITVRESGTFGGNLTQGLVGYATGGWIASASAATSDQVAKEQGLSKLMEQVNVKLRDKLGARIAHEGPPGPDAVQVPA